MRERLSLASLLWVAAAAPVTGQLPPAAEVLPAGFQLVTERNLGGSMVIEATRPNAEFPAPHMDHGITLSVSWAMNPMAGAALEYLAAAPEDPADDAIGIGRDEPCGKTRHRGGVLTCRKLTTPWGGDGEGPDLITWSLSWAGATDTGLIGVSVSNLCGPRETGAGWIDRVIDRIAPPR